MTQQNTRLGIMFMIAAAFVFAFQDGLSRHLASIYDVRMVVMIRYWFFALFVIAIARKQSGSIRAAARSANIPLQIFRGILLAAEICVMVVGFVKLGLVESHAIFASYPLIVAALSGPVLGEKVGWRRWAAIGIGFLGVMVILEPGVTVFAVEALYPLASALMFALYGLLTRFASRKDSATTSFFWTGVVGAIVMTAVGLPHWEAMTNTDYAWMALLCVTGALGHFLLIKCYEVAEASAVQPFAYLQLIFASAMGIIVFGDILRTNVAVGVAIVVSAGLFALLRERKAKR